MMRHVLLAKGLWNVVQGVEKCRVENTNSDGTNFVEGVEFLHGELMEEVYMDIPLGFGTIQTVGKVCRLWKSLYGLRQSPQAWFDKLRRDMVGMGYQQINTDHKVFS